MTTKMMYGYCRVSTMKQGDGTSLIEQKRSIECYALKHNFKITRWFEEKETAAKQGRPKFTTMLELLNDKKADGVVIHKIDRSARNLRDWATLGDLIDRGVDVHFSDESVDFSSNGGRLAADINAVFAANYVRNLRDETKKGQRGRLRQGLYPWGAPLGYLDQGRGNVKIIDPDRGSLIKELFEVYSTGLYTFERMSQLMYQRGLRSKLGGIVSKKRISEILNNPFYTGIILLKKTGETYSGKHKSLVSPRTFKKVQEVLSGKRHPSRTKHDYLYRKCIKCDRCNLALIAEKQKGHTYYRCQTFDCSTKTVREEAINLCLNNLIQSISFTENQLNELRIFLKKKNKIDHRNIASKLRSEKLKSDSISQMLESLAEKFAEDLIDQKTYEGVRTKFLFRLKESQANQSSLEESCHISSETLESLLNTMNLSQEWSRCNDNQEKRRLIKVLTSKLSYSDEQVKICLNTPFDAILQFEVVSSCCHARHSARTEENVISYTVTKKKGGIINVIPQSKKKKISKTRLLRFFQSHDVMKNLKQLY